MSAIDILGFKAAEKQWWIFELKKGRSADRVVGQASRYLGWILKDCSSRGEDALGAILVGDADSKLEYAVGANTKLSLWRYGPEFDLSRVV